MLFVLNADTLQLNGFPKHARKIDVDQSKIQLILLIEYYIMKLQITCQLDYSVDLKP